MSFWDAMDEAEVARMKYMTMPNERTRAYFYRLSLGALAALVLYGVLDSGDIPVWTEIVAAALGITNAGLATANTNR